MSDVTVTRSGEVMTVAGVTGETDEGIEFVDAWLSGRSGSQMTVVDSGRLVIQAADVESLVARARAQGLDVAVVDGI